MSNKAFGAIVAVLLLLIAGLGFIYVSGNNKKAEDTLPTTTVASESPAATPETAVPEASTPAENAPASTAPGQGVDVGELAAAIAAGDTLAKLIREDSKARNKKYSTYGGGYYRGDQVATDPMDPIEGFHKYMGTAQALEELPFLPEVPGTITAFQLAAQAPDGTPGNVGNFYVTFQTDTGYFCTDFRYPYEGIAKAPLAAEWNCGPIQTRLLEGQWMVDTFKND